MKGITIIAGGICLFVGVVLGHIVNTVLGFVLLIVGVILLVVSLFMREDKYRARKREYEEGKKKEDKWNVNSL